MEVDVGVVVEVEVEVLVDAEVLVVGSEVVDVDVDVAVDADVVEEADVGVLADVETGPWRPQPPATRAADTITQVTSARAKARFKQSLLIESLAGQLVWFGVAPGRPGADVLYLPASTLIAILDLRARIDGHLGAIAASLAQDSQHVVPSVEHDHLVAWGEESSSGEVLVLVEYDEPLHMRRQLNHQSEFVRTDAAPVSKQVVGYVAFWGVADQDHVATGALDGGESGDDSAFPLVGFRERVGDYNIAIPGTRGEIVPLGFLQPLVESGLRRPHIEGDGLPPGVDDGVDLEIETDHVSRFLDILPHGLP